MKLIKLIQVRRKITEHINDKLSTALAYKLMRFLKATESDVEFYEDRMRALFDKCGKKDGEGNLVVENGNLVLKESTVAEFGKEYAELCTTEAVKPEILFTIDELEPLDLTVNDMLSFDDFIIEK